MYDSLGGGIVPISCKPHAGITTTRISTMHTLINVASGLSDVSGVADSQITAISYSCVHVMTILWMGAHNCRAAYAGKRRRCTICYFTFAEKDATAYGE